MNTDTPSAELDLEVAKAIGYQAYYGNPFPDWCFLKSGRRWKPSADMTDAWEAAEESGILVDCVMAHKSKSFWVVCKVVRTVCVDKLGFLENRNALAMFHENIIAKAPTGPLAICAAILATKETQ